MPQTILALLALMIASLFSLQMHRQTIETQQRMIRNELALQSTGVAEDKLGEIGTMHFDEAVKHGQAVDSYARLTAGPPFADGGPDNDDIDDFNGSVDTLARAIEGEELHFRAEVRVVYVPDANTDGAAASHQTKTKRVTVRVRSVDWPSAEEIRLSRTFTCGGACNF